MNNNKNLIIIYYLLVVVCSFFTSIKCNIIQSSSLRPELGGQRIVNGQPTYHGQFPYQVLVLKNIPNNERQSVCGGVLLNREWILTAAHCTIGAESFELHLGAQTFYNYGNESDRQIEHTNNFIIHEHYNAILFQNDLALIRLNNIIKFSDKIQPVKLPDKTVDDLFVDREVISVGWGVKHTNDENLASTLQWAIQRIISPELCRRFLGNLIIHDTTICAQGDNMESTCFGDSGGPLVLESDSITLVGITSFGHRVGCHFGIAQGFSRITKYIDWINRRTGGLEDKS